MSLRKEYVKLNMFKAVIDVSLKKRDGPIVIEKNHPDMKKVLQHGLVQNAYRDGTWGVFRHVVVNNSLLIFV